MTSAVLACACAETPASVPAPRSEAPSSKQATPSAEVSPAEFCDHFLAFGHCDWAKRIGTVDRATCMSEFEREDQRGFLDTFGPCMIRNHDCDSVTACMGDTARKDTTLRECAVPDSAHPRVGIPLEEWKRRKGAGISRFRDASTTKDAPIESCGIDAQNAWLALAACDDGSHPIRDAREAELARKGNVGPGGRCRSIIDLYEIHCPEATYSIYLDLYMCPR
jgi:hypothetical protein